jgi:hypothetical protein
MGSAASSELEAAPARKSLRLGMGESTEKREGGRSGIWRQRIAAANVRA